MGQKTETVENPGRRRFVAGTSVLVAAGMTMAGRSAASQATRGSAEEDRPAKGVDYDVVVLGGGYAGVAAARDSMENGYRTLLLEARNRLGGRTFTTDFEGAAIELGGTWIHHTQPFVWAEKERYDLEIVETPGAVSDVTYIVKDGKRRALTEADSFEILMAWQTYHGAARQIVPRAWDILHNREAALAADRLNAMQHLQSLELSELQRDYLRAYISLLANGHPETMSYLEVMRWHLAGGGYLPTVSDSLGRFKLKEGTISLIDRMIEDGGPEVRMSTPVKGVEDRGELVVVTTARDEQISARAVICCLPMNTIGSVSFTPALPSAVLEAGEQRHAGAGFKLYMKVKGDVGNLSTFALGEPLDMVMTYKQAGDYTLLLAFGKDPAELDVYDDEAVAAALKVHVPEAELLSSMSYDWNNDPYAKGTWAVYRPGWMGQYSEQFQKDQGRILFGSGDHGEGWRGFIDGAIGGGIKAAQRAKELLA